MKLNSLTRFSSLWKFKTKWNTVQIPLTSNSQNSFLAIPSLLLKIRLEGVEHLQEAPAYESFLRCSQSICTHTHHYSGLVTYRQHKIHTSMMFLDSKVTEILYSIQVTHHKLGFPYTKVLCLLLNIKYLILSLNGFDLTHESTDLISEINECCALKFWPNLSLNTPFFTLNLTMKCS